VFVLSGRANMACCVFLWPFLAPMAKMHVETTVTVKELPEN